MDVYLLTAGLGVLTFTGAVFWFGRSFLIQRTEREFDDIEREYFHKVVITEAKKLGQNPSFDNIVSFGGRIELWRQFWTTRKQLGYLYRSIWALFLLAIVLLLYISVYPNEPYNPLWIMLAILSFGFIGISVFKSSGKVVCGHFSYKNVE